MGHRILHSVLVKIIIGVIVVVGAVLAGQLLFGELLSRSTLNSASKSIITGTVTAVLSILSYTILYRFYEKRIISELSTLRLFKNIFYGFLLGAFLQSITILIIYLKGGFTILSVNPIRFLLPAFTMAFTAAIFEEILVRGIIFRILEERLGSYAALIISALIFGALHLGNPNSSFVAALGLALQAGVFLAAAFVVTRNLWFPIAIHFAWNFTQAGIFGANVSGNSVGKSLFTTKIEGAEWYTGGAFGPEGSIQATVFCASAAVILIVTAYKNKSLIPYPNHKRR